MVELHVWIREPQVGDTVVIETPYFYVDHLRGDVAIISALERSSSGEFTGYVHITTPRTGDDHRNWLVGRLRPIEKG